ncbi:hypothetical protein BTZ20_2886 [Rhodococcus sp. MTM3W5.2]|nr:hypothetical protein BTZ20_2886 [Rhodococcus sp. MTM3W5.2]
MPSLNAHLQPVEVQPPAGGLDRRRLVVGRSVNRTPFSAPVELPTLPLTGTRAVSAALSRLSSTSVSCSSRTRS